MQSTRLSRRFDAPLGPRRGRPRARLDEGQVRLQHVLPDRREILPPLSQAPRQLIQAHEPRRRHFAVREFDFGVVPEHDFKARAEHSHVRVLVRKREQLPHARASRRIAPELFLQLSSHRFLVRLRRRLAVAPSRRAHHAARRRVRPARPHVLRLAPPRHQRVERADAAVARRAQDDAERAAAERARAHRHRARLAADERIQLVHARAQLVARARRRRESATTFSSSARANRRRTRARGDRWISGGAGRGARGARGRRDGQSGARRRRRGRRRERGRAVGVEAVAFEGNRGRAEHERGEEFGAQRRGAGRRREGEAARGLGTRGVARRARG
mmetsp:Transcript_2856/g.10985  ORF Transcript_2856/g.10985 Transcript_2856/m.10985 type:complete len:331 (-) Transcript_2856:1894-2886(-)